MSGPRLFQTRMGQRFYEVTMPAIAEGFKQLNVNLEALVAELRRANQHTGEAAVCPPPGAAIPSPGDRPG
jgi:hypothetical protein